MKIGNKDYKQSDLKRKIGNLAQLGGTRHYELSEGNSKGVRAIDFNTGSGLYFSALPDRGLDISLAYYKGVNLVYQTPNGEVNPAYYNSRGLEWLRTFFGGLLTTCGLTYFGPPGKDGDEELGLHGRCSTIPAKQVCDTSGWDGDEYRLEVSGTVEECSLFGDKVRLVRTITSQLGKKSLLIRDRIENFGFKRSPFTILYHINAGFPLLDDKTKLIISATKPEPYNKHSDKGKSEAKIFTLPKPGFQEQNYLYSMRSDRQGYGYAALINPNLLNGLGMYLKFKTDTLPFLSEWKMMGEGDYVVGIEPCNVKIDNRAALKEKNMLPFLEPGETKEIELELGVLEGDVEIKQFNQKINRIIKK